MITPSYEKSIIPIQIVNSRPMTSERISALWRRLWIRYSFIAFLAIILIYVFRINILQGLGNFLAPEDQITQVDAIFVLGGNSLDRGKASAKLYDQGIADLIVCSGGNIPSVLEAIGEPQFEHEITRALLYNHGVPEEQVDVLTAATSTWEEAQEIVDYCNDHKIKSAVIVSSKFHLRRVRRVFSKAFGDSSTELIFHGAPSSSYDESQWWKSEAGLIMVNNEYVKLGFYMIKY